MLLLKSLRQQIIRLDSHMNTSLSDQLDHLLMKTVDLGDRVERFLSPTEVYCFGINYTFFEDIEDEQTGERPNDVYFSLMVFVRDDKVKIEQVVSGRREIELPTLTFSYSEPLNVTDLVDFDKVASILFEAIQDFLTSRDIEA